MLFKANLALGEWPRPVAQLDIEPVEEGVLGGMRSPRTTLHLRIAAALPIAKR